MPTVMDFTDHIIRKPIVDVIIILLGVLFWWCVFGWCPSHIWGLWVDRGIRTLFDEYTEDVNPVLNANGMVK